MYSSIIDFNMLVEINKLLKENNFSASMHSIGGCACCGVKINDLSEDNREKVLELINNYLKNKFMYLVEDPNDKNVFYASSTFNK